MSTSRRSKSALALNTRVAELAIAAPQVVAHRLTRMALAGATPNARDQAEFKLMSDEKMAAFQESWMAMSAQALRAQQQMAMRFWQSAMFPWMNGFKLAWPTQQALQSAMVGVASKGLAPVHRRAVANSKRLGRGSR